MKKSRKLKSRKAEMVLQISAFHAFPHFSFSPGVWLGSSEICFLSSSTVVALASSFARASTTSRAGNTTMVRRNWKASYEELKRLNNLNPHPGRGKRWTTSSWRASSKSGDPRFLAKAQRRFETHPGKFPIRRESQERGILARRWQDQRLTSSRAMPPTTGSPCPKALALSRRQEIHLFVFWYRVGACNSPTAVLSRWPCNWAQSQSHCGHTQQGR